MLRKRRWQVCGNDAALNCRPLCLQLADQGRPKPNTRAELAVFVVSVAGWESCAFGAAISETPGPLPPAQPAKARTTAVEIPRIAVIANDRAENTIPSSERRHFRSSHTTSFYTTQAMSLDVLLRCRTQRIVVGRDLLGDFPLAQLLGGGGCFRCCCGGGWNRGDDARRFLELGGRWACCCGLFCRGRWFDSCL